jgi:3-isopropylmalate/(R)-2-methylmalate dehydratase small subunit
MAGNDRWEEPLPTITGRAWAFGMALSGADLLSARFAAAAPATARRHLFADLDVSFADRLGPGDVLIADAYRGSDGEARPALAALAAAGVVALVARTFDAAIDDAALAVRVVPVELDAPAFIHTGDRIRIDLDAGKVVNLSSGDRAAIKNLDEARRAALRALFARA